MLSGQDPDTAGLARGVFLAAGFEALSCIKSDFITKSRGGTGADGNKWQPLSKKYLAYGRRFGSGEQASLKKAAGLGRQNRLAPGQNKGLLTTDQLKRWNKIFAQTLTRMLLSLPPAQAKARAAQIAWATLKREGAKTKLEVYGNRTVDILKDTGILLNSLSPGQMGGAGPASSYTKPSGDGGDQQIFEAISNGIIVGTNVPYAAVHNFGSTKLGIPARPFLPKEAPDVWKQDIADTTAKALEQAARLVFEGAISL